MGCQVVCGVRWNGLWVVVWFHLCIVWSSSCIVSCKWRFLSLQSMWWVIGLVSPAEWNVYEVFPSDMYLQVRQFFPREYEPLAGCVVWDCEVWPKLQNRWGCYYVYKLLNGCSFKEVIATGGWNKDVKVYMFANNGRYGTKGCVVGDNEGNTSCFVQCGSVMGHKCFCPYDIVNSLYFEGNSGYSHVCKGNR